jgi:aspartate aminotransferase-like enzyme
VDPEQVAEALRQHPDAVCVMGTLSETSTGTGHPIEAIGRIVARTPALFAVDGISGVGAMECRTDDWSLDLLCVGSQKALMIPPGLAFVSVSAKAWAKIDSFNSHSYYFNLKAARTAMMDFDTPYTPAHTLILALRAALRRIKEEGLENIWKRHRRMSEACQAGVQAVGLELYSAGYTDELDVIATLAALEMALAELGYEVEPGRAVTAAQQVLIGQLSAVGS